MGQGADKIAKLVSKKSESFSCVYAGSGQGKAVATAVFQVRLFINVTLFNQDTYRVAYRWIGELQVCGNGRNRIQIGLKTKRDKDLHLQWAELEILIFRPPLDAKNV